MKCGLLGRRLAHSYSPAIHAQLGDYSYELFEKEPEELEDFIRNGDWDGINVTIPYKQTVIPFLDEISSIANELGAVNTIIRRDGKLIGHNTDYWGFDAMLKRSGLQPSGKKCLVLGSGGASKVVQFVLKMHGAQVVVISRSGENNYENLHRHADAAIIVNTTPLGMHPNTGVSPIDVSIFPHLEGVLDLIYNPARTQLLLDAEKRDTLTMNGLWMLVCQAIAAAVHFGAEPKGSQRTEQIHRHLQRQMENIVLIGMPGSGKTTVGKLLAEKTGKVFLDTDAEIEKRAQKSIPHIFAEDGEAVFRAWETQVLADFGKESGFVIATGGGCVIQARNVDLLRQNSRIIWLQRDLNQLATDGRPLSTDLQAMYLVRKPLYETLADHVIRNNGRPENTVNAILEVLL